MSLEKQKDGKTGPLGLLELLKVFALGGTRCYEKGAEIYSLACWQRVCIRIIVRKQNQEIILENVTLEELKEIKRREMTVMDRCEVQENSNL